MAQTYGFTKQNWKLNWLWHPVEDSYRHSLDNDKAIMVVGDGVTRDPTPYLPSTKLGKAIYFSKLFYPNPSPAKEAANLFTRRFMEVIENTERINKLNSSEVEEKMRLAFSQGNKEIFRYNQRNGLGRPPGKYTTNNLAGCVASAVYIDTKNGRIIHGFIGDSLVGIVKNGEVLRTPNEGPAKTDKYMWNDPRLEKLRKERKLSWNDPVVRSIVRRNVNKTPLSLGILNGEEQAMGFVRTDYMDFDPERNIAFTATDGLEKIIFRKEQTSDNSKLIHSELTPEFRDALMSGRKNIEELCQKNIVTEGTIVAYNQR